jgi:hypothetical protein
MEDASCSLIVSFSVKESSLISAVIWSMVEDIFEMLESWIAFRL